MKVSKNGFRTVMLFFACYTCLACGGATLTGELKQWHKLTFMFRGPVLSETGPNNPFLDYRLNVTFQHVESGEAFTVPGYFAADGNAATTSATSGNVWKVHFSPGRTGKWVYSVDFKKAPWIAVRSRSNGIPSGQFMDGETGAFEVTPSDKEGQDFRSKGRLSYVGQRYLVFSGTGEVFLKCGPDAPENFLAFKDFDGTFHDDGHKDGLVKDWAPHLHDWQSGDPEWRDGKGKAIIGALNYLAAKGLNSVSFLTNNVLGDDQNVFPYTDYESKTRFDCSKLDQWEIVFSHAQSLGIFLHFKLLEAENQGYLDDGGVGLHTRLYLREMVARFGHHLALNWNLCEEIGDWWDERQPTLPLEIPQRISLANTLAELDPYHHHMVVHNGNWFTPLYGEHCALTGASLQTDKPDFSRVNSQVQRVLRESADAGKVWAVACDEPGDAQHSLLPDEEDPEHFEARTNGLWGAMLAGAWGTEWYFGYAHAHSDLTCQDYRSRDKFWNQAKVCLDFFRDNPLPLGEMQSLNSVVSGEGNFCFGKPGQVYVALLKYGGEQSIDLSAPGSRYEVSWYDPRSGGALQTGTIQELEGTGWQSLGLPPSENSRDWIVLVTATGAAP